MLFFLGGSFQLGNKLRPFLITKLSMGYNYIIFDFENLQFNEHLDIKFYTVGTQKLKFNSNLLYYT